jgi:hypothetical protein
LRCISRKRIARTYYIKRRIQVRRRIIRKTIGGIITKTIERMIRKTIRSQHGGRGRG